MDTIGQHLIVEFFGCNGEILNESGRIEQAMRDAAVASGASIVACAFHQFAPQGVSGVVVVEESHLSIHTWPERGYAACDFYTCGDCVPKAAHDLLMNALGATESEVLVVRRGLSASAAPSLEVSEHYSERDGERRNEERADLLRPLPRRARIARFA